MCESYYDNVSVWCARGPVVELSRRDSLGLTVVLFRERKRQGWVGWGHLLCQG